LVKSMLGIFWAIGPKRDENVECAGQSVPRKACQWKLMYKFVEAYVNDELQESTIQTQQGMLKGFETALSHIIALCEDDCTTVEPSTLTAAGQNASDAVNLKLCKDATNLSTCPFNGKVVTVLPSDVVTSLLDLHVSMTTNTFIFNWTGEPLTSTVYFSSFASMHIQVMLALYHASSEYSGPHYTAMMTGTIKGYITYAATLAANFAATRKAMVTTTLQNGVSNPPLGVPKDMKYYASEDTYKTGLTQKLCWSQMITAEFTEGWADCSSDICIERTATTNCTAESIDGMQLLNPKVSACGQAHKDNLGKWLKEEFLIPYLTKPAELWQETLKLFQPAPLSTSEDSEVPESLNQEALDF